MISRWVEFCLARTEHEGGEGEAKRTDGIDEAISLHNLRSLQLISFPISWVALNYTFVLLVIQIALTGSNAFD